MDNILLSKRLQLLDNMDPEIFTPQLHDLVVSTFDTLCPSMIWTQKLPSISITRRKLEKMVENRLKAHGYTFGIFSKEHDKLIGLCTIKTLRGPLGDEIRDQIDSPLYKNPCCIGYWISKHYEGSGYATEACKLMLEYGIAQLGVDCYLVEILPENEKSAKVVERLEFTKYTHAFLNNMGVRSDWPYLIPVDIYRKLVG